MTVDLQGIERLVVALHPERKEPTAFVVGGYSGTPLEERWKELDYVSGGYTYKELQEASEEGKYQMKEYVRAK